MEMKEEVAGSWRRLDNEELYKLSLANVTSMKLRNVRCFEYGRVLHIKLL
jgi:hypothetical protein